MSSQSIRIGVMAPSACSYLAGHEESVAVVLDPELHTDSGYGFLVQSGFRRSGNNIYRPYCNACTACHSLRVDTHGFIPSRSQKRHLSQLKRLTVEFKDKMDTNWFSLYERYISARHRSGSMYPANKEDFRSFVKSDWQTSKYLHLYEDEKLIAIAVTDLLEHGYSAIYSFFEPAHAWSLGSLCVLAQIEQARKSDIPWLYLGFQIDACSAMNYKQKFKPHQRYVAGSWIDGEQF
ncbi:arginyltransferase [Grimontia marina]|uniref:Aspartate/glutamate leucyltransferase n=1 Tax=Grimontia marina TaxID=646534 RepID=A0A128FHR6_9GAMM|nr:arginyltransferase [Grimontia marina]CZF86337.1 Putative arginyl-tRNA--protein transferase [Grimontia marina]